MLHRTRVLAFVLFTALVAPAAGAQQRASDHSSAAGPRVELASTAMRSSTASTNRDAVASMAARRQGMGQPVALMIVGGAGLLAGLIIGGDAGTLIAIGGLVAGLIGLYQYLQ